MSVAIRALLCTVALAHLTACAKNSAPVSSSPTGTPAKVQDHTFESKVATVNEPLKDVKAGMSVSELSAALGRRIELHKANLPKLQKYPVWYPPVRPVHRFTIQKDNQVLMGVSTRMPAYVFVFRNEKLWKVTTPPAPRERRETTPSGQTKIVYTLPSVEEGALIVVEMPGFEPHELHSHVCAYDLSENKHSEAEPNPALAIAAKMYDTMGGKRTPDGGDKYEHFLTVVQQFDASQVPLGTSVSTLDVRWGTPVSITKTDGGSEERVYECKDKDVVYFPTILVKSVEGKIESIYSRFKQRPD